MIRRGDVTESDLRKIGVSLGTRIRLRNISNTLENGTTIIQASNSVAAKPNVRVEAVRSNRQVTFAAGDAASALPASQGAFSNLPTLQDLTDELDSKQSTNVLVHSAASAIKFRICHSRHMKAQGWCVF